MIDLELDLSEILCSLIRIDSVTGNEKKICDEIYNKLSAFEGEINRVDNNIIYSINCNANSTIALIGHLDTVPIGDSTIDPKIDSGKIWGRGACDMKAGIACMLKIINEISSQKLFPKNNISFVFYEKEEGPIPNGINRLINKNLLNNIEFAYVLEPTNLKYSIGCLGALTVKKNIYGVPAHSANPFEGRNAIGKAFKIFKKIEAIDNTISKIKTINNLEYYETVNITSIGTKNAYNVIPAYVEMVLNYRFSPLKTVQDAKNDIYNWIGEDDVDIIDESDSCLLESLNSTKYLYKEIEKEIMQAWTDIAQLNKIGIPAVNYGPGSIKLAHKPDERIKISQLNEFYKNLKKHL